MHEHRPSRPTFCERLGELGGQRRRGGSYARFVYHARKHIEGVDDLPPVLGDHSTSCGFFVTSLGQDLWEEMKAGTQARLSIKTRKPEGLLPQLAA